MKSADEYALKAESSSKLTSIGKSNSFRRSAKEKECLLKVVDSETENLQKSV